MESNNAAGPLGFNHSKQDGLSTLLLIADESEREILPEDVLLRISRSHATLVSEAGEDGSDDASRSLRSLLEALICTTKSALLSAPHRASACNALCGFLEYGIASSNLELRTLCFSASIWTRNFDVFIERSEGAKSKPMRQVLVTLVKVLCRNPDPSAFRSIRDSAVTKLLVIILGKECLSFVKPALHALEHFISKQIIDISDILPRIIQFHPAGNTSKGALSAAAPISRFEECALPPYISRSINADPPQLSHFANAIHCLFWSILDCVRIHSDMAPVAGRLLSSILFSLQRTVMEDDQDGKSLDAFVRPIHSFIKQHPDLIELSAHHLLPGLLRLDSSISTEFLKILPLDDLERGLTSHLDLIDIQIFLMASKAREEFGLVPYNYADNLTATMLDFSTPYGASIELLLLHVSPSIRLAALNFATSSKSTTALITENVLSSLRECLPQFHAEADAKSRNEFISTMKKLLTRLKGGLAQTSRSRNLSQSVLSAEASGTSIKPLMEASDAKDPSHALINCNVRFLKWYIMFLSGELLPTASYPRHITALKLLQLYLRMSLHTYMSMQYLPEEANGQSTREINGDCFNDRIVRLLFDLLMDPFEDVRSMAVLILKLGVLDSGSPCQDSKSGVPPSQFFDGNLVQPSADAQLSLVEVLRRAQDMMHRTGRADHADGAGRIHDLLYFRTDDLDMPNDVWKSRLDMVENVLSNLKAGIKIAKENLRMAVFKAPLHGHLIALRYIVSQPYFFKSLTGSGDIRYDRWRTIHDEISFCCTEVWQAVKGVLCLDSPEGHMGDFEEDDLDIGVKDTLSFLWRALKESSALQHAIIINETYGPSDPALGLHYHDLRVIGGLAFTQLAELRHRGAFSSVSQTFAACCTRCIKSNDSKVTGLPEEWYQDTLSCIHEKASALTRRSAGIPAMITSILVAHPSSCFLENVILDMQAISDTPVKAIPHAEVIQLPQVHAMNCLKDIFTNTQLGPRTEPYIADTLHIAAGCLESDVWAIQNCGLMLLKALINRLLGKNEASSSTVSTSIPDANNLLYDKFPNLPGLIVKLLQPYTQFTKSAIGTTAARGSTMDIPQAQKVFPALEIIQRAGMPPKYRLTLKPLLLWHLGSTIWYIRKKTAKTFSIVTDASRLYDEVTELLQEPWSTQNSLHGRLLCVRDLLFKASDTVDVIPRSIIQSLLRLFKPLAIQNRCPFTITAYMDVVADLLRSQRLSTKVDPDDKRRLLDIESELWYKSATYGQLDAGRGNLLSRSISRCDILAAQHRLDTIGSVDGINLAAIPNLFRQLAKGDPDILYRLVIDFEDVIYQWRGPDIEAFQISTSILLAVVSEVPMEDVKAVAMSKLCSLLSLHSSRHVSAAYTSVPQFFAMLESFSDWNRASIHSSPQVADGAIRLQGAVISTLTQAKVNSFTDMYGGLRCAVNPLEAWTRTVGLAGDECNEPHIRIAAAASLEGFQTALRQSVDRADTRPEFLGIYLVLYDTLNDDDTEIREKGASIVSWTLLQPEPSGTAGSATSSLSPLAAKSRLLDFLIAHYNNSTALCHEAVGRLAGVRVELGRSVLSHGMANTTNAEAGHSNVGMRPMLLPSLAVSLGEARKEDTALFSEEKQNLYIDEVQEACGWAIVITKLSSPSIERDLAHELEVWVMQGLAVLAEMAQAEVDGPLGWTTKPEVFTMGARIICAAGVLLHWASIGVAGVLEKDIREALQALHSAGGKNSLHGSWMQRIEELLQRGL